MFDLMFPVNFTLAPSTICDLFIDKTPNLSCLDVLYLAPIKKGDRVNLKFMGLTNIDIKCKLGLFHMFEVDIKLISNFSVSQDAGFEGMVKCDKPINFFNANLV